MRRQGFTLIELAIVLVIIGLIVGGVLAGRELIHTAMLRKQMTQIEQYNTAVNTFFGKYNTFPGDLSPAEASQFGFATRTGARGHGDKNGVLETCSPAATDNVGCEKLLFWGDLSNARLISENLSANTDAALDTSTYAQTLQYTPATAIDSTSGVFVAAAISGGNVFSLAKLYQTVASGGTMQPGAVSMDSRDVQNIDIKMDDGFPLTGKVTSPGPINLCASIPGSFDCTPSYGFGCIGQTGNVYASRTDVVDISDQKFCRLNFYINIRP